MGCIWIEKVEACFALANRSAESMDDAVINISKEPVLGCNIVRRGEINMDRLVGCVHPGWLGSQPVPIDEMRQLAQCCVV